MPEPTDIPLGARASRPPIAEGAGETPALPGDAELLRDYVQTGSQAAFAAMVRRHVDAVYSAALRRLAGDTHLAKDVTQRVFIALARKAEAVSGHPLVSSWLYTVTRHEAANAVRTEQRRKAREQEAMTMQENDEPETDWSRVAPVLDEVVDELAEADRTAILLRFVDRRPFAEIGATLRVSEDAARMRVERALEKLRVLLGRRGVTSSAAALGAAMTSQTVLAAPAGLAASVTGAAMTSAATLGPVATAIQFMATSKITVGVAGVVMLMALGTAVRESSARQTTDTALAAATTESARLEGRLRDAQAEAARAEQARDAARANLAAAEAAAKPATPAPAAPSADPQAAGREFLAQHPEAKALWDERERANIGAKLGPVARAMHLTAAEQERLENIFLQTISGVTTLSTGNGVIALRREATLTRAQGEAELVGLLGPERAKQFAELSANAPAFDLAARLASAVYRTDPLTADQAAQVMQILAKAAQTARAANPRGQAVPDWNAIATEAGAVLSPRQLAALTTVRQNLEYQQAVQRLADPAFNAAPAPKLTTPPTR